MGFPVFNGLFTKQLPRWLEVLQEEGTKQELQRDKPITHGAIRRKNLKVELGLINGS